MTMPRHWMAFGVMAGAMICLATGPAYAQSATCAPPCTSHEGWRSSFVAGWVDRHGQRAGGSQLLHLVTHKGHLHAANGCWNDKRWGGAPIRFVLGALNSILALRDPNTGKLLDRIGLEAFIADAPNGRFGDLIHLRHCSGSGGFDGKVCMPCATRKAGGDWARSTASVSLVWRTCCANRRWLFLPHQRAARATAVAGRALLH